MLVDGPFRQAWEQLYAGEDCRGHPGRPATWIAVEPSLGMACIRAPRTLEIEGLLCRCSTEDDRSLAGRTRDNVRASYAAQSVHRFVGRPKAIIDDQSPMALGVDEAA